MAFLVPFLASAAATAIPLLVNKALGGGGGGSPPPPPALPPPLPVPAGRPMPTFATRAGGAVRKALPYAAGAASGAIVEHVIDSSGRTVAVVRRRRRARGFSGRDIRQLHRLFKMLHKFNRMAPRHTGGRSYAKCR